MPDEKTYTCKDCGLTFVPSFEFDFYPDESGNPESGYCENCMLKNAFGSKPSNEPVPIPEGHDTKICKRGMGAETCAYLGFSGERFQCLKNSSFEEQIKKRLAENSMGAKSDNCSGPPDFGPKKE